MNKYYINDESSTQNSQHNIFNYDFSSITLNSLINEIHTNNSILSGSEAFQDYVTKNLIIGNKSIKPNDYSLLDETSLQAHIQNLITQHHILPELKYICEMYNTDYISFLERCPKRYLLYLEYKQLFYNHYKFTPHIKLINELITNSHKKGFINHILLKSIKSAMPTNVLQKTALDIDTQILSALEEASLTMITIDPPKVTPIFNTNNTYQSYNLTTSDCITVTEHIIVNLRKISQYKGAMKMTLSYKISLKDKHKKIHYHNVELLIEVAQQLNKYIIKVSPSIIKFNKLANFLTKSLWKILSYVNIYRSVRQNNKGFNILIKQSSDLLSSNFTYSLLEVTLSQRFFKKLNLSHMKKVINLSFLKVHHNTNNKNLLLPHSLLGEPSLYYNKQSPYTR
ncbi:hypothetical protein LUA82_03335 [Neoehrlichia mikurensis]|uniref:Uncharacterized protein n=1 Tax=Neoehrlichia mikurensis TaxID=89586 RepID=A0A9Q9F3H0_9RICK|nr:hypothetical protein [Neoehrlichia mikurensis]UTO55202.1 hypothetical protein LUA82_03335 [Neoehrlichia mikurensis]UTO56122.1 hypothetical protein LUA81_03305 [Neoehrlichia mikurensis]